VAARDAPCGCELARGVILQAGTNACPPHRGGSAFPQLPPRAQCTRHRRPQPAALVALLRPLGARLAAPRGAADARESAGGPPREAPRRGAGW
jgi:hypothetical protein